MAGLDTNIALAANARRRREAAIASGALDPVQAAQSDFAGPEMDALLEGLKENEESAKNAGLGFRAIARGGAVPALTGDGGAGLALTDDAIRNRMAAASDAGDRAQAIKIAQDNAADRMQQGDINDLYSAYQQHVLNSTLAPPMPQTAPNELPPGTSVNTAPNGTVGFTMRGQVPTSDVDKLSQLPGSMKANLILPIAGEKLKESEAAQAAKNAAAAQDLERQQLAEKAREFNITQGGTDVAGNVRTTLSGKPYLDLGDYQTPTDKSRAQRQAQQQGITAVSPAEGASLQAADTAKQNIAAMWSQIESKLPKDPTGRIVAGPTNKLSQYFQTDPELAAFNSFRAGAIQAVQALVERGMGFRLNKAEIDMIMQNDMPQVTDTYQTAKRRIDNVMTLLQNKENSVLTRNRSELPAPPAANAPPAASAAPGKNPFRK